MNKKIFKFSFVFLFSVLTILTLSNNFLMASNWDIYSLDKNVFVGSIIFPKSIKNLPEISLYRRGLKIKTENEQWYPSHFSRSYDEKSINERKENKVGD